MLPGCPESARTDGTQSLNGENEMPDNFVWGIAELMGHLTLAGRLTKPGEYGGLWQIDIPEGENFRTEFFAAGAVYRIRIVSEEIARAYSTHSEIVEYNAPIVTRDEHERKMDRARELLQAKEQTIEELQRRLTAIRALPSSSDEENKDGN